MFKLGDFVQTTQGFMSVQCAFKFVDNKNPRYDKLGGKTLYWLQDEQYQDILLWDHELNKIITKEEQETSLYDENSFDY